MTSSNETLGGIVDAVSYTSDSTGQLLSATATSGPPTESYTYSNGNRETVTTTGGQVTCITGPDNELLYDGTYYYQYDADGNQVARWVDNNSGSESSPQPNDTNITIYTWDNRDRLTSVTSYDNYTDYQSGTATQTVTCIYDVFNRWIGETVTTYSGGSPSSVHTTDFAYDGNQIVLQFDKDGTGNVTASDLSHRCLNGPAVDEVLADEQLVPVTGGGYDLTSPGNVVWTLTDNEGTVRDLATYNAQTGVTAVANHRVYDSFGNLTSQTNAAVDCLFGFTGLPFDKASGTNVTPTRRYDPTTGRWDGPDTDGFGGGDPNLYRYCGNSPTNHVDPSGEFFLGFPSLTDYWRYLTHPQDEDKWCQYGQAGALIVAGGAAVGAGGLVVAGAAEVTVGEAVTATGAAITGASAKVYIIGTLTAAQLQQLIASSGDKVVVLFTKLASSPAANRALSTSTDTRLCQTIQNGTMYVGRIPADVFARLEAEGFIEKSTTMMNGVVATEYRISAQAMQILQQYFQSAPPGSK
jgi:RHS repeat-associated protein